MCLILCNTKFIQLLLISQVSSQSPGRSILNPIGPIGNERVKSAKRSDSVENITSRFHQESNAISFIADSADDGQGQHLFVVRLVALWVVYVCQACSGVTCCLGVMNTIISNYPHLLREFLSSTHAGACAMPEALPYREKAGSWLIKCRSFCGGHHNGAVRKVYICYS